MRGCRSTTCIGRRRWWLEAAGGNVRVGLADGRIVPLTGRAQRACASLKLHDAVYVRVTETRGGAAAKGKGKRAKAAPATARAELRVRPTVQGAAVVLENQTGRILAMAGGFSYPLSQLNRVTQSQRQPGSAIKPISYLAALAKGLQPNTLVRDEPLTLPPIGGVNARTRPEDYWTPKNYDGGGGGIMTLRRALENVAQPRDRQPVAAAASTSRRRSASTASARWRWKRRSIGTARATTRSCWARSRCGRSISPPSSPPSPTRACARRRM